MDSSNGLSLSRTLDSLRLEDDKGNISPNIPARRQLLDDLINNGLLNSEIRYVRERLNAIPPPTKDIFWCLPRELQMQVVGYLDLTTIIRMACVSMEWRYSLFSEEIAFWVVQNNPFLVEDILSTAFNSRAWRNVLLQKRISLLVIERHFRQRWYQYSTAQPQQSAEDLQEWLANSMESLMKQRLPAVLRYYNFHWKGKNIRSSLSHGEEGRYANGRVAYRYDERSIVVHGLRKIEDSETDDLMFMHRDRVPLQQWLLSDEMILAQISSPRRLMIESFRTRESRVITLPSGIKYWTARGQHFAIVTESHEVLSGTLDGSFNATSELPEQSSGQKLIPIGIHYHPAEEGCFYIFYTVKAGDKIITQEVLHRCPSTAPLEIQLAKGPDSIHDDNMPLIKICDDLIQKGIVVARRHSGLPIVLFDMYTKQYCSTSERKFYYDDPIADRHDIFRVLFEPRYIYDEEVPLRRGCEREAHYMVCCCDADVELVDEGNMQRPPGWKDLKTTANKFEFFAFVNRRQMRLLRRPEDGW